MKIFLVSGVILLAAACSPAPANEAAAPAAPATPAAPAGEPGPAGIRPEIAILNSVAGRWGITMEACGPTNDAKDGVVEITPSTLAIGLDACTIRRTEPEGAGIHMVLECKDGEGGPDYERDFSLVSSSPETFTWIDEGGAASPYSRCP
jgi:hypothetical protein